MSALQYIVVEPLNNGYSEDHFTVEPPNNGHSGDRPLVHCREVVPISEVKPCTLQLVGGNQFELQTTQAAVIIKPLTYVKLLKYSNRIMMVISDLSLISSNENLSYCTTCSHVDIVHVNVDIEHCQTPTAFLLGLFSIKSYMNTKKL